MMVFSAQTNRRATLSKQTFWGAPSPSSWRFRFMLMGVFCFSTRCYAFGGSHMPFASRRRCNVATISPLVCAMSSSSDLPDISTMKAREMKQELESYGISTRTFLEKTEYEKALQEAREQGMTAQSGSTTTTTSTATENPGTNSESSSSSSTASRKERLAEEIEKCRAMKAGELKRELEALGVSTKALFEKSELVQALAEARVDGKQREEEVEYKTVEVVTDGSEPQKRSQQREQEEKQQQSQRGGGSPFGGGANPFGGGGANPFGGGGANPFGGGGANPFGGGGANPFGGGANPFGGGGANPFGGGANPFGGGGANPFGGGANPFGGGGGNPFGGGMPDMGTMMKMMQNPKIRAILEKAQSNPRMMSMMNEVMSNPGAFAKYQNDPEFRKFMADPDVRSAMEEFQREMGR